VLARIGRRPQARRIRDAFASAAGVDQGPRTSTGSPRPAVDIKAATPHRGGLRPALTPPPRRQPPSAHAIVHSSVCEPRPRRSSCSRSCLGVLMSSPPALNFSTG
jgi:hypothetical protein